MAHGREKKLTEELKVWVVQQLACFETHATVRDELKAEHGIEITKQALSGYDPTTKVGERLSEQRKALFHETRKQFLESTAEIGVAHRAVRLRMLERMALKAEAMGNLALAASMLEQAAKEVGDVFTNKRLLEGSLQVNHDHRVLAARERIAAKIAEKRAITIEGKAVEKGAGDASGRPN